MKIICSVLIVFSILVDASAYTPKTLAQLRKDYRDAVSQLKQIRAEQAKVRETEQKELEQLRHFTNEGRTADLFWVKIDRTKTVILKGEPPGKNKLVIGTISVNGKIIGKTYENGDLLIPLGDYGGIIRYTSKKGFVQNPLGRFGNEGDFLLEVAMVPTRTDILFHGGNKPKHSKGCILLGPVGKDALTGKGVVGPNHPLRILRHEFYGADDPYCSPNKSILIRVTDQTLMWSQKAEPARAVIRYVQAIRAGAEAMQQAAAMDEMKQGFQEMEQRSHSAPQNIRQPDLPKGFSTQTVQPKMQPYQPERRTGNTGETMPVVEAKSEQPKPKQPKPKQSKPVQDIPAPPLP